MKLTDLSDEILLKILEYLSTYDIIRIVALVSKKFNHLSKEFKLIQNIAYIVSLDDISSQINYLEFCDFLGRSKNLRSLELEVYSGFDFRCNFNFTTSEAILGYNVVKTLADTCPKLHRFKFISSDDIIMVGILEHFCHFEFKNLEEIELDLHLAYWKFSIPSLSKFLDVVNDNFPKLCYLKLIASANDVILLENNEEITEKISELPRVKIAILTTSMNKSTTKSMQKWQWKIFKCFS